MCSQGNFIIKGINMFIELDNLLSADTTVDSWYDDGCLLSFMQEKIRFKYMGIAIENILKSLHKC
ncbi:hypothetical protein C6W18_17745 [Bacillus sp. LLTC93]|nr:hypothetical protein C6W18_17745 [Bacillus sp. LLTC93]